MVTDRDTGDLSDEERSESRDELDKVQGSTDSDRKISDTELAKDEEHVVTELSSDDKYAKYRAKDPLPNICPALLSAADIRAYIKKTALLEPTELGSDMFSEGELFKPAAFALRLKGKCTRYEYNDNKLEEKPVTLDSKDDCFVLPKNSIAYVTVTPMIRLPWYIAARFNLKIGFVYRGLLLGTGPMIDPGFVGHLTFPLHNLTDNEYRLYGNERIIWMEFTKINPPLGVSSLGSRSNYQSLEPFVRESEESASVNVRISAALEDTGHTAIVSSLPGTLRELRNEANVASENASEAKDAAKKSALAARLYSVAGVLATAIALAGLFAAFVHPSLGFLRDADSRYSQFRQDIEEHERRMSELEERLRRKEERETARGTGGGASDNGD